MEFLSEASDAEVVGSLDGLVEAYRGWIEERRYEVVASENLPDELASVAERHLQQAKLAADRIAAGITVLRKDPDAMTAFCLMNEAMVAQRRRQVWVRSGAHGAMAEDEHHWRPFQLAFILLNLAGLSDPNHPTARWPIFCGSRQVAEPEAYLGLIAYTVLFRRLKSPNARGVSAIMRYTLRLLTIQQFERATTMMCALERVRRGREDVLGRAGFSMGLVARGDSEHPRQRGSPLGNGTRSGAR